MYQVSTKHIRSQLQNSLRENAKLLKDATIANQNAQKFAQTLLKRHEDDRRAISRELHDEVAQLLTGINFELSVLVKEASNSDQKLQKKISDTQLLISQSVEVIHQFARQLRPVVLDELGLIPALKTAIQEFKKITNIDVEFVTANGITKLNNTNKTVLFRVAQEALFNIIKHAEATKVSVKIKKYLHTIRLEVSDNGKSFDQNTKNYKTKHIGIGIQGMEERVKMVKGVFKITSNPGVGTKITATIPFEKEEVYE